MKSINLLLLFVYIAQSFHWGPEIDWNEKRPICIKNPNNTLAECGEDIGIYNAEKPNLFRIKDDDGYSPYAIYMDGSTVDCNKKYGRWFTNDRLRFYNYVSNRLHYVDPATTSPFGYPQPAQFVFGYSPEPYKLLTNFGGVQYFVDFSLPINFKGFSPLWMLTIGEDFTNATWSTVFPNGDVPSDRTEMSIIEVGEDLFMYGGVNLGAGGFTPQGDAYYYTYDTNSFSLICSNCTPGPRYHSMVWNVLLGSQRWIIMSQGVGGGGGSSELEDSWGYNLNTGVFHNITHLVGTSMMNVTYGSTRRHGIQYQFESKTGIPVICTSDGDLSHESIATRGCAYAISPANNTICSYVSLSGGLPQLSWFVLNAEYDDIQLISSKYLAGFYDEARHNVYKAGGDYAIPISSGLNKQVWNENIRVGHITRI